MLRRTHHDPGSGKVLHPFSYMREWTRWIYEKCEFYLHFGVKLKHALLVSTVYECFIREIISK